MDAQEGGGDMTRAKGRGSPPEKETPRRQPRRKGKTTSKRNSAAPRDFPNTPKDAALWWYNFGLRPMPQGRGTKRPRLKWDSWLERLENEGSEAIKRTFTDHDDLCALLDDSIVVFDADTSKSRDALYEIEAKFNATPNLIVKTAKGEHHYFRRAPGTHAKPRGFDSKKDPEKIDIRTGRSTITLPPSTGKLFLRCDAASVEDLVEIGQDFIDAIFAHNGEDPPRPRERKPRSQTPRTGLAEAEEILSYLDPDMGYSGWVDVGMGLHWLSDGSLEGLELYDDWSSGGSKYPGYEAVESKWHSFDSDGGITWATVCKMAEDAGADLSEIGSHYDQNGNRKRTYDEVLADTEALDNTSHPDRITELAAEANGLGGVHCDAILKVIKNRTGTAMKALRAATGTERGRPEQVDQLTLGLQVIELIGRDNLIVASAGAYQWDDSGVWRPMEDRALKQQTQRTLENQGTPITRNLVDGVIEIAKNELYQPEHEFNQGDPETVNCLTGELVLGGGQWELRSHTREHYRTTQIPVQYDLEAEARRFIQFLDEIFANDDDSEEKRQALLEMMGYTLMAHCRYEKFVLLIGSGSNGKSVFLDVLTALCGKANVSGIRPSELDSTFKRAHLLNKLANIVSEIRQGEVVKDDTFKAIVSGESTTVEEKHKPPFDLRPFATCWFGTNHMPHTRDFSDAFFRRALVVEFNEVFKPGQPNWDPKLKDKLLDELPGILNLALGAYARMVERGYPIEPASSRKAKEAWRLEADQVAQFVEEMCTQSRRGALVSELFSAYQLWAEDNGIHRKVTKQTFGDRLVALGYQRVKTSGVRRHRGVKLQDRSGSGSKY